MLPKKIFNKYIIKVGVAYILQNCKTAFEELVRLNLELAAALKTESLTPDINRIGALHE